MFIINLGKNYSNCDALNPSEDFKYWACGKGKRETDESHGLGGTLAEAKRRLCRDNVEMHVYFLYH